MRKLTKKDLDELSKVMPVIHENFVNTYAGGGGSGSGSGVLPPYYTPGGDSGNMKEYSWDDAMRMMKSTEWE